MIIMRPILKLFKALSDSNRLRILKMLEIKPLCVCEITEILDLANSTVSKHLSILRDADLILDEKDGKWVNYELNKSIEENVKKQVLSLIKTTLTEDDVILMDVEKVKLVDRNNICGT
jgi:ArsR family transcriptional regulator, arsenate/arsenite/antimonite-responsive transcriptional repressor